MEGIAYGTRQILETLAGYGHAAGEVLVCGGATRSEVFMQIYADVCGLPMAVTEVSDAPLLADAVLCATGLGAYPDLPAAAAAMVRITRTYAPDPARHAAYAFYYDRYRDTYAQLRDLIHQTAEHESAGHEHHENRLAKRPAGPVPGDDLAHAQSSHFRGPFCPL